MSTTTDSGCKFIKTQEKTAKRLQKGYKGYKMDFITLKLTSKFLAYF